MTRSFYKQRVTIFGFGRREGVSLVRYLHREGAHILISDIAPSEQLAEQLAAIQDIPVEFDLEDHNRNRILEWSDAIFVSPAIRPDHPILVDARVRGITISSAIHLFLERCSIPVTGITGSAGKTTTTSLISTMLAQSQIPHILGGNIGRPVLGELACIDTFKRAVLELSSFQLMHLRQSPNISVVTNITPNHLDWHRDWQEYVNAKRTIVAYQGPSDWAILNADDPTVSSFSASTPANVALFSITQIPDVPTCAFLQNGHLVLRYEGDESDLIQSSELQLRGQHNIANALAAALAAHCSGAHLEAIATALRSFTGVSHRLQLVAERDGVRYFNDSIATTPERVLAALRAFSEPLVVILAGRDKHLPWDRVAEELCFRARSVILTGDLAPIAQEAIIAASERIGRCPKLFCRADFDEAVQIATLTAQPGDCVLFTPGGTSFDHFRDFEARGQRFNDIILQTMVEGL
ncbi:MAG: UDP-N-acetylmuramoyl-L-alanine--D-glutamate ligase [Chloroflexi bacterium]|nr:UDP-N-acetylmuramoyl-L-alanine--D-glutamate ligase [Chloroflexota bacterium]